jgi:hypothetical protein
MPEQTAKIMSNDAELPLIQLNFSAEHSLGKGEVDSSILSGSTRKNSVAEMLYLAGRGRGLRFLKLDFGGFADMRRQDASIWFMIAAAVFATLAVLALLLVYGPA